MASVKLNAMAQKVAPLANYFWTKVILPTLSTFFAFTLFVGVYWIWSGISFNRFAPQQLDTIIQKYLGEQSLNYQIFEIDFHGFGNKSYVILTENGFEQNASWITQILVLDEIQPNPIERLLFSEKIFKKSFQIEFESRYYDYFHEAKVIQFKNKRQRLFFCVGDSCGLLQFNGKYEIVPLVQSITPKDYNPCGESNLVRSNNGSTELTKIPMLGLVFIKGENDEELFVASPEHESDWVRGSTSKFKVCSYYVYEGDYSIKSWQGLDSCYVTEKEYYDNSYPSFVDENDPHTHEALFKDLGKGIWPNSKNYMEVKWCENADAYDR